jgi:hypothetical protein
VHWNSGILNHWFYLLVTGGQHHNSIHRTGEVINGIGIDDAFEIWFQAWTVELDSTSTFEDARVATLAACADLVFDPFTTCGSVQNAWAEVGLGSVYVPSPTQCSTSQYKVEIVISETDQYANLDNSLTLTSSTGQEILAVPQFENFKSYLFEECLDINECYSLNFIDTYGDG